MSSLKGLKDLQPRSRVARVGPLVPAIAAARARGVAWGQIAAEIGTVIGIEPGARWAADAVRIAYREAVLQIKSGRLTPDPAPASDSTQVSVPAAPPTAKQEPSPSEPLAGERSSRSGWPQIPIDKPFNK
jgi:hypothetical protein